MLTEANKLTCRPRWRSELAKCFAVLTQVLSVIVWYTKCKTDSGRKFGYYAAILSGKEDRYLWSRLPSFLPLKMAVKYPDLPGDKANFITKNGNNAVDHEHWTCVYAAQVPPTQVSIS